MTKEEITHSITGMEYGDDISPDILKEAKENGLIIIYGYSDDLIEFEGAFQEEVGCYHGNTIFFIRGNKQLRVFTSNQLEEAHEAMEDLGVDIKIPKVGITAWWCPEELDTSWLITTDLPHANFHIMEDGDLFCRGVVISIDDVLRELNKQ